MNSINLISKYSYDYVGNSPVSLNEYVLVVDESTNERYLILKFYNSLSETAHKFECNIKLYNENNFMTENLDFSFDGDFGPGYFIPELKLKVSGDFNHLSIEFNKIIFEKLYYDGEIKKIPIKLTEEDDESGFINDSNQRDKKVKKTKWQKKKDKLEYKSTKRDVSLINKRKYATDASRQNRSKIAIVLASVFSVIVIAYFLTTVLIYSLTTTIISDEKFDYMVENNNTLKIVYCHNVTEKMNIPAKVDGKNVLEIDTDVFKDNKKIKEVKFSGNIIIGKNAFNGCTNLEKIDGEGFVIGIRDGGLYNTALKELDFYNTQLIGKKGLPENEITELSFPKAKLKNGSLLGCQKLETLEFKELASGVSLKNVISKSAKNTLKEVKIHKNVENYMFMDLNLDIIRLVEPNLTIKSDLIENNELKCLSVYMTGMKLEDILVIDSPTTLNAVEIQSISQANVSFFDNVTVENVLITSGDTLPVLPIGVKRLYIGKNCDVLTIIDSINYDNIVYDGLSIYYVGDFQYSGYPFMSNYKYSDFMKLI